MLSELFDWEYQPVELEAALNLSLWIPFRPEGPVHDSISWTDIEPGHRFVHIILWLRRRGQRLTAHDSLDAGSRNSFFQEFFQEACSALDWPHPFELAMA